MVKLSVLVTNPLLICKSEICNKKFFKGVDKSRFKV